MRWLPALIPLALAAIILAALADAKYEREHPCLRYEQRTCETTDCSFYTTMTVGDVTTMYCAYWETRRYTCTVCTERKP